MISALLLVLAAPPSLLTFERVGKVNGCVVSRLELPSLSATELHRWQGDCAALAVSADLKTVYEVESRKRIALESKAETELPRLAAVCVDAYFTATGELRVLCFSDTQLSGAWVFNGKTYPRGRREGHLRLKHLFALEGGAWKELETQLVSTETNALGEPLLAEKDRPSRALSATAPDLKSSASKPGTCPLRSPLAVKQGKGWSPLDLSGVAAEAGECLTVQRSEQWLVVEGKTGAAAFDLATGKRVWSGSPTRAELRP